jgi:signal transduction histidine kinase
MAPDPPDGLSVLVVEDNPADAALVEEHLAEGPVAVAVSSASRLSEAVDLLARQRFDCVLLDLGLPDADGVAALEQLRAASLSVPVIVLTGRDDENLGLSTLHHGAQDYLVKGRVDGAALRRAVRYAIERKAMDDARSEFIARAAHELRTPLSVLAGLGETVARAVDQLPPERLTEIREALARQADRARTLISQLLELSQAEMGRVTVAVERLDLGPLVASAVQAAPPPDGVTVTTTGVPAGLVVRGDRTRVEQILTNLLTNAYKYGGPSVEVSAVPGDSVVGIVVADDGPGVAGEVRAQVFEPFVRGARSTRGAEGSGLGLAISRRLAEVMHGSLDLDDDAAAEGGPAGSRFVLTLPV